MDAGTREGYSGGGGVSAPSPSSSARRHPMPVLPSQPCSKLAVTDLLPFIVTVQVEELPLQSPLQPVNELKGRSGVVAVSVTVTGGLASW